MYVHGHLLCTVPRAPSHKVKLTLQQPVQYVMENARSEIPASARTTTQGPALFLDFVDFPHLYNS